MSARLPLADIRFLADFHAFALSKGDETYNYADNQGCACAQFLKESGRAVDPWVSGDDDSRGWRENSDFLVTFPLPTGTNEAVCPLPWTFSALATRLETLLADAPAVELVQ